MPGVDRPGDRAAQYAVARPWRLRRFSHPRPGRVPSRIQPARAAALMAAALCVAAGSEAGRLSVRVLIWQDLLFLPIGFRFGVSQTECRPGLDGSWHQECDRGRGGGIRSVARKRRVQVSLEPREPGTGQIGTVPAGRLGTDLPAGGRNRAGVAPDCAARANENVAMIRSWMKTGAAEVLSRTGLDKVVGSFAASSGVPVVIGYHRVVEDFTASAATSIPSMLVSRHMLERHLDWIGHRFRFVSLDEVGARLEGSDSTVDPIAAITFDDGYSDFYDHAFPLLKQNEVPAAVFVVTDLVNTTGVQIHDKLYLLLARRAGTRGLKLGELAGLLQGLGIALPNTLANTPYQATRVLLEALAP